VSAQAFSKSRLRLGTAKPIVRNKPLHFIDNQIRMRDKRQMPAAGQFHDAHVGNPVAQIQQTRL